MKKLLYFSLSILFLFGFILRLIYFKDATFGWDQARDAFAAINIWQGDFVKIIGPSTAELPGLHHGPLYWYLISPFYYLSGGNIYVVRLFLILLNLLGIFIIYHFAFLLFNNKRVALFSGFLFAISFEACQYGRWLSNPSPALITIPLTFLGLWYVVNKKNWGIPLTLISWAFSVHFQFFLVYQIIIIAPILIWFYKNKKLKFNKKDLIGFFGLFFILLPFIIAEFKFQFQGIKSFTHLFENQDFLRSFSEIFLKFFDRIVLTFYLNIFGLNLFIAGFITISIILLTTVYIYRKKQYYKEVLFLGIWLLSPMFVISFEKAYAHFVTIGNLFPAIILTSFFIIKLSERIKFQKLYFISLAIIFFLGQSILMVNQNKTGESLFSVQIKMILSDELKVIDYIYKNNKNKPFMINTVTNPLFVNTTWTYLFDWYGRSKYGYMPIWGGYPQDGQFGSNIEFSHQDQNDNLNLYLIIEPQPGIPKYIIAGVLKFEDTRSKLVENKTIGGFTVQKRRLFNNNNFDMNTVYRLIKQIDESVVK